MLYDYLKTTYKLNEPIFISDIHLANIKTNHLRQMMKLLCDTGILKHSDTGIYYLPQEDTASEPSHETLAYYKYISRNNLIFGYYSGQTFAFHLGITKEQPSMLEIVSNQAGGKYREVELKNRTLILRKPKCEITKENQLILQFLDLLKDLDLYIEQFDEDCRQILLAYMKQMHITKSELDTYIYEYPDRLFRFLYKLDLYDSLSQPLHDDRSVPVSPLTT